MGDLYAPYVRGGNPILFMSNRSAELSKYAANAFLAMKISFINDMALLAEKVRADIHDVRRAIVTDSRIGSKFLYPGCGYGGSCFPKDVLALDPPVGKSSARPWRFFPPCTPLMNGKSECFSQKYVGISRAISKGQGCRHLGNLSFKPETDDMREAPSVTLITRVARGGLSRARLRSGCAGHEAKRLFENQITLVEDANETIQGADFLAILTEWNEFRSPDFDLLKKRTSPPCGIRWKKPVQPREYGSDGTSLPLHPENRIRHDQIGSLLGYGRGRIYWFAPFVRPS